MTNTNKEKGLKSVVVKCDTYERLLRRKKYPRESFDTAINRVLDGDTT